MCVFETRRLVGVLEWEGCKNWPPMWWGQIKSEREAEPVWGEMRAISWHIHTLLLYHKVTFAVLWLQTSDAVNSFPKTNTDTTGGISPFSTVLNTWGSRGGGATHNTSASATIYDCVSMSNERLPDFDVLLEYASMALFNLLVYLRTPARGILESSL